jgi:heme exporter protein A
VSTTDPITVAFAQTGHRFGRRTLFRGLDAVVAPGEVVAVLGPNGTGKSTLLKLVAGLVRPTWGAVTVAWAGRALGPAGRRAAVGYAAPDVLSYRPLTVAENLAFSARVRGLGDDWDREVVGLLGLADRLDQPVAELSSGYVQRVRLALALLHRPPVLLLDEPGANLDDDGHAQVAAVVARQRARGLCLVAANDPRDIAYGTRHFRLGG